MLQLHFGRADGPFMAAPGPRFGPFSTYRFERNQIRTTQMGEQIARFEPCGWDAGGVACSGFQFIGSGRIHFESAAGECSRSCGPFTGITGVDALIRVANGHLFASFLEREQLWHAFAVGGDWPVMVLTALPGG